MLDRRIGMILPSSLAEPLQLEEGQCNEGGERERKDGAEFREWLCGAMDQLSTCLLSGPGLQLTDGSAAYTCSPACGNPKTLSGISIRVTQRSCKSKS